LPNQLFVSYKGVSYKLILSVDFDYEKTFQRSLKLLLKKEFRTFYEHFKVDVIHYQGFMCTYDETPLKTNENIGRKIPETHHFEALKLWLLCVRFWLRKFFWMVPEITFCYWIILPRDFFKESYEKKGQNKKQISVVWIKWVYFSVDLA